MAPAAAAGAAGGWPAARPGGGAAGRPERGRGSGRLGAGAGFSAVGFGLFGCGRGGGGYAAVRLGRFAIVFHSSSSPSPVCAEISGTGTSNTRLKRTCVPHLVRRASACRLWFPRCALGHWSDAIHPQASRSVSRPGWRGVYEQQHGQGLGRPAAGEVRVGQAVNSSRRGVSAPRISVAGQVHQIERRGRTPLHPVKVGQPGLAGGRARSRQRLGARAR